ncbi:MAG: hypothetical protein KAI43_01775 [Candidatus Aureabacteria bacterium]|nr:hypothetical protein [Candidatus Auribacterota bacterium]
MVNRYKTLLDVQEIDINLIRLQKEIKAIPAEIAEMKKTNADEKRAVEKVSEKIKSLIVKKGNLETEIETKKNHSDKLKGQLLLVKKNDEYKALSKEIAYDLKNITKMEDETLEIMESIEKEDEVLKSKKVILKNKDEEIKGKEIQSKKQLHDLNEQLEKLKMQKEVLKKEISPSLLKLYIRIFQNKKDFAVVEVVDNKVCGGCRMSLTANVRNEARKDNIVQCDNCSRILYVEMP